MLLSAKESLAFLGRMIVIIKQACKAADKASDTVLANAKLLSQTKKECKKSLGLCPDRLLELLVWDVNPTSRRVVGSSKAGPQSVEHVWSHNGRLEYLLAGPRPGPESGVVHARSRSSKRADAVICSAPSPAVLVLLPQRVYFLFVFSSC